MGNWTFQQRSQGTSLGSTGTGRQLVLQQVVNCLDNTGRDTGASGAGVQSQAGRGGSAYRKGVSIEYMECISEGVC